MRKSLSIGLALLLTLLAGLAVGGSILAQGPDPTPSPGARSAWGRIRVRACAVSDAIADLLGLTTEEIYAERQAGKTLGEIANERGVSDETLIVAMVAEQREAIEQAVAEGTLTREQADWLIAKAEAMAPFRLTNPFASGEFRGRMRGGMMRRGSERFGPCPMPQSAPSGSSS